MPATPPAITIRLADVEDGYARAVDAANGQTVGTLSREKHGSSRTGTAWSIEMNVNYLNPRCDVERLAPIAGRHATRTEAVAELQRRADLRAARRAAA